MRMPACVNLTIRLDLLLHGGYCASHLDDMMEYR